MIISGKQIRAARMLIDWDAEDLAKQSSLNRETIFSLERGEVQARAKTLDKILRAFDQEGIEFLDNDGVRRKSKDIKIYRGTDGFQKFIDDIYMHAQNAISKKDQTPICVSTIDDKDFLRHLGDYFTLHVKRMNDLSGCKMRILLKEKPASLKPEEQHKGSYREYRRRSPQDTANIPFYVYGDRLAILMITGTTPEIIVITSSLVAQAYREVFNTLWNIATPFK